MPCDAQQIEYEVAGGGGAGGPAAINEDSGLARDLCQAYGGHGALERGTLTLRVGSSCGETKIPLIMIAGGGGIRPGSERLNFFSEMQWDLATGYGNGGRAMMPFVPTVFAGAERMEDWAGSGGAGSALAVGTFESGLVKNVAESIPDANLLVVAGGGGSGGSYGHSRMATSDKWNVTQFTGGAAGDAESDAQVGVAEWYYPGGTATAFGGGGAAGASGGAGARAGSTDIPPEAGVGVVSPGPYINSGSGLEAEAPYAGRGHGTGNSYTEDDFYIGDTFAEGNFGGGNGAEGIVYRVDFGNHQIVMVPGAGGGGYAGGGAGGFTAVGRSASDLIKGNVIPLRSGAVAITGSGGGGSNYHSGGATEPGTKVQVMERLTSSGIAGNGHRGQSRGSGAPGWVELRWMIREDSPNYNPTYNA